MEGEPSNWAPGGSCFGQCCTLFSSEALMSVKVVWRGVGESAPPKRKPMGQKMDLETDPCLQPLCQKVWRRRIGLKPGLQRLPQLISYSLWNPRVSFFSAEKSKSKCDFYLFFYNHKRANLRYWNETEHTFGGRETLESCILSRLISVR